MATTVCSKTISLKVWNADSTPKGSPIVSLGGAGFPNTPYSGNFGTLDPGYYRCTNIPGGSSAVGFTLSDLELPPTISYCYSRGGGYGDFPGFPPVSITPGIGTLKGWSACSASAPAAEASCNAGMLTLEPLLDFELLVPTVVGWSYPGYQNAMCVYTAIAWNGAAGLQFSLTQIGKL